MQRKDLPWTMGKLEAFQACPYRYYRTDIVRDIPNPSNQSTRISDRFREAFAHALVGEPLMSRYARFQSFIDKLRALPGKKEVNTILAIDHNFKPCSSDKAWVKSQIDYLVYNEKQALLFMWRTGAFEPSERHVLQAALYFTLNPACVTLRVINVWLQHARLEAHDYGRDDLAALWRTLMPQYTRFCAAHRAGTWSCTPNGLCNKHCHITECKYCGQKE